MFALPASSNKHPQAQKRFRPSSPRRPMKKCAFDIDSLLKPSINSSYVDDTEDGSSDDGHLNFESSSPPSYCQSPISSYTFANQLKTNAHSSSLLSSSFDSEQSMISQRLSSTTKLKRIRTIFTIEQLERLEVEFEKQQYMVGHERLYLAKALDLSEAQVKIWFQNRRIKWRRQILDNHQQ